MADEATPLPALFRCPLCGGNAFRTEWAQGSLVYVDATGVCKGPMVRTPNPAIATVPTAPAEIIHRGGCTFTWSHRDDHLYRGPIEPLKDAS